MYDPGPVDAQARLAAIVESSDDAIISKTLNGIVMTWNRGAERIFGYAAQEMIGRPMTVIIPPDRQHEEPAILAGLRNGQLVDHFETVRMRKDGQPIDVSVTISPVRDAMGRLVGASTIARDISAQKQIEELLRATRDAAEAAGRAKDQFLSALSHELRTPLTPALAALSYIESHPELPATEVREQVSTIRRNVETEARLVDDLLDVVRIARGQVMLRLETIDAHAALRDAVQAFSHDIDRKSLTTLTELHAKRHYVSADPGRFQQVLLNLLSNAVKFTPPRGTITVRSVNDDEVDGDLRIEVSDTGIGIDRESLSRLFTAFEQGDERVSQRMGGLGLGLSIVRSLMGLHGGTAIASSEGPGRGATFTLQMASLPSLVGTSPVQIKPPLARDQRCTVLLVEDHDDTRRVMTTLLRSFGCAVIPAATVREAIECSDRQPFDLLLSDVGLPDGTGMDIIRHMLASGQKVRGIAISGFGQEDDLRRSRDAGFARHLTKPVNIQVLREVIVGGGGEWASRA